MKDLFKLEEFAQVAGTDIHEVHCKYVNEKLNKLIESWPVVFNTTNNAGITSWIHYKPIGYHSQARLAFIEKIKKECVNHIPKIQSKQVASPMSDDPCAAALVLGCSIVCLNCGVELQATWSEKK